MRQSILIVTGILVASALIAVAWRSTQHQSVVREPHAEAENPGEPPAAVGSADESTGNHQIGDSDHTPSPRNIPVPEEVSSAISHGDISVDELELGPGAGKPKSVNGDSSLDPSGPGEGPDDIHTSGPGPGAGYDHDLQHDDGPGADDVDINGPGPGEGSPDIGGPGPGDRG